MSIPVSSQPKTLLTCDPTNHQIRLDEDRQTENRNDRAQTVLIVEPRSNVFALLATELESVGFHIAYATTAFEAYEQLADRMAALVIANITLPDESGWLLAEKIDITNIQTHIWLYAFDDSFIDDTWVEFSAAEYVFHSTREPFRLADLLRAQCCELSRFPDFQRI